MGLISAAIANPLTEVVPCFSNVAWTTQKAWRSQILGYGTTTDGNWSGGRRSTL